MKNIPGNYYNKHKSNNPLVRLMMNNFHSTLFEMIESVRPNYMLDVGCGEGYTIKEIKNRFPEICIEGTDIDAEIIEIARKENPGLILWAESAYSIDKDDGTYDLVTTLEVLEHLEYPDRAISESKRLSKKYCIYSVPFEPYWRVLNVLRFKYIAKLGNTPGHINHWGRGSLKSLLSSHFKNVELKTVFPWNFALCYDE